MFQFIHFNKGLVESKLVTGDSYPEFEMASSTRLKVVQRCNVWYLKM